MSSLALSNLAAQTQRAAHVQSRGVNQFRRRWIHNAMKRQQGIMMPALSPFMTEGTVTRWKKKEGESFVAGDVLLQIENEVGMVDVEAEAPGIMGKILTPDGTAHVPVEAVIALVARDMTELTAIQSQSLAPTPPTYLSTPSLPSASLSSPNRLSGSPRTPTMARTPSLFEMHTMGYGQRTINVGSSRGMASNALGSPVPWPVTPTLDEAPRSPRAGFLDLPRTPVPNPVSEPATPMPPKESAAVETSAPLHPGPTAEESSQLDGAAIRRMIVANLSATRTVEVEEFA